MKTASELLDEILRHVKPPRGCAVVLAEETNGEPNWIASTGVMHDEALGRFNTKTVDLRKAHPCIDWSGVTAPEGGRRRIAKYFSELE
jgi:hypothetical protein